MRHEDALQILDLVESGIIMLDNQRNIVFWNQFVAETALKKSEEVNNQQWLDVFPNLEGTRIQKAIDKAIDFNFPSILSYKLLKAQFPLYKKSLATKPPYLITQSIIVKPLIDNGDNNGCIIYINDVSATSKREKELNIQTAQLNNTIARYESVKTELEQVFDNTHNGIIIFDAKGNIINANNTAALLFDNSQNPLTGSDISNLLPDLKTHFYDDKNESYCYHSDIGYEFEQKIQSSSGKYFSVSVSKINNEDNNNTFFLFVSDITQRKQAEEKLLKANVELEEFAYRTSHDLRSPIVSSLGLLDIAQKSITDGNTDKVKECLELANTSLTKLEVLIQDILKLTEMENAEESEQAVDVEDLINSVFHSMRHMDGFEKAEKIVSLGGVDEVNVKLTRFRMIIENLVSNAIKYQDPDQTSPHIEVKLKRENSQVFVDVSDNGLGIPEDQQQKLFKMFNRFHPKVSFGSGLGLYLIKKSAHVLGGDIEYVHQPIGARFRLTIPHSSGDH